MLTNKQKFWTLVLLCLGYFIDFYDLTIMSVSYPDVIRELFGITDMTQIQQTYLMISSFQTAGVFIGAITFGIIGDKFGRANAIKYSIFIYSLSTIAAIFTHSLPLFIVLRVIAYAGLATEFSTSTVLIVEMFSNKNAARGTALLYSVGVLGGMCAIFVGILSWKMMFICGGVGGLIIFIGRRFIKEPEIKAKISGDNARLISLVTNKQNVVNLLKLFLVLVPYFATITTMFIMPNYIVKTISVSDATKSLLIGFFIGNIISSLISSLFFKHKKLFLYVSLLVFIILSLMFNYVGEQYILLYFIGVGLIGGGYPIVQAQLNAHLFDPSVRNTANNVVYALGRLSSIGFNALITTWIIKPEVFLTYSKIMFVIVFVVAVVAIKLIRAKPVV
ncbi:MAG: MFS transporter [Neisseriaceae bacterium]|nr:MAG: MFS transporter [Neisseriaceae bacterium]